jgi:hypothetical protein
MSRLHVVYVAFGEGWQAVPQVVCGLDGAAFSSLLCHSFAAASHALQIISIGRLLLVRQGSVDGNRWMRVHPYILHIPIHRTGCQHID